MAKFKRLIVIAGAIGIIVILCIGLDLNFSLHSKNVVSTTSTTETTAGTSTAGGSVATTYTLVGPTNSSTAPPSGPLSIPIIRPNFTVSLQGDPTAMVYDPYNNMILETSVCYSLVCSGEPSVLTAINAITNKIVKSIPLGKTDNSPTAMAYDPANHEIYVSVSPSDPLSTAVIAINSKYQIVATIPISNATEGTPNMVYDPTNSEMYLGLGPDVLVVDQSNNVVANFTIVGVLELAYDPALGTMYISSSGNMTGYDMGLYEIGANNVIIASSNMDAGTMIFDPATQLMYVFCYPNVCVVSGLTVISTLPIPNYFRTFGYSPANQDLYVVQNLYPADSFYDVAAISNASRIVQTVALPSITANQMIYDANRGWMIVTGGNLVLNSANSIVAMLNAPHSNTGVYVPSNSCTYVLQWNNSTTSVFC